MKEAMRGTIFDIRRFSTHDGHGIRTTVFLKGCPLSCVWCHNPEGISTVVRPLFFPSKCIKCGTCLTLSQKGGIVQSENGIMLHAKADEDWNKLIDECPAGAIAWDSRQMTVQEVVQEVMKDQPFYRDDGGVTLSGGEPLVQAEFCLEILKALKQRGVHTAIETALHVPSEVLRAVIPYLDLIYADFKIFDSVRHRQYVGVPNDRIKENIQILLESAKRGQVIIRTPMIPGLTSDEDNIQQISRFISDSYDEVSYELLNYNPLAEAKYHLVDQEYYFKQNPGRYSEPEMLQFAEAAHQGGVKHVIIES